MDIQNQAKRNFRGRRVACGYSQVPGIDFNDIFAPVIYNVSLRSMLKSKDIRGLQASFDNVESASLHGDSERQEEIVMNIPEGFDINSNHGLPLKKIVYNLIQRKRKCSNS
jgi:Reverse transcriptase (RNA-dependent DNA polymerase)